MTVECCNINLVLKPKHRGKKFSKSHMLSGQFKENYEWLTTIVRIAVLGQDNNPKSFLGRIWRWHTTWCPGWKAYMKSLPDEERMGWLINTI